MTETQTPPPACSICGDTGSIPPFMDPCTCGRIPVSYAPEFPSVVEAGAAMDAWDAAHPEFIVDEISEFRPTIPGTEIPTPGFPDPVTGEIHHHTDGKTYIFTGDIWKVFPVDFPLDPKVGQITWNKGKAYAWDGSTWRQFDTEALTYEQYHARYGEGATLPDVDVEREADDAALFARRAAEMEIEENTAAWDAPESTWSGGATWGAPAGPEIEWADVHGTTIAEETDGEYVTPAEAWGWDKPEVVTTVDTIAATVAAVTGAVPLRSRKPASAAQGALLARLIAERDPANILVQAAKSECAAAAPLTAKRASQLIDSLLKIPATAPKIRENMYDGVCVKCGGTVPSKTGRIEKSPTTGRWQTFHLTAADCITDAEKAVRDADRVDEPGLYFAPVIAAPTGDIYRVRQSRGSKRLYGEKIVTYTRTNPDGTEYTDVRFIYNANALLFLRKSDKLTWAEARAFGKAYGACVACGRTLEDPRSLVQSYGPKCAENYHWPTVTKKQAEAIIAGTVTWEEVTGALTVL